MERSSEPAERYLQSVVELVEDGETPIPSKVARRMGRHITTISGATARLQRAGLILARSGEAIELTAAGAALALTVVRKHRVIECFLDQIVGVEWPLLHQEAVRWQHVVTDGAEVRMARILDTAGPTPYGSRIPAVDEFLRGEPLVTQVRAVIPSYPECGDTTAVIDLSALTTTPEALPLPRFLDPGLNSFTVVSVSHICEFLQADRATLGRLDAAGVRPGVRLAVARADGGRFTIRTTGCPAIVVDRSTAVGIRATT